MAAEDCGAYGHPNIRTPHIDRLAREGMLFERAFLTCSSCSPSRASLLTGSYPHQTGAQRLHMPLPVEQIIFPELLRDAGYHTASIGKWHLGTAAQKKLDRVSANLADWRKVFDERPAGRPFFLWLASYDPHRPYGERNVARRHRPEDAVVPPYLPDAPETRRDLADYYDEIARFDGLVGEVLEELDRRALAENTFVLFLSDNGRPFPRCKTTVYDSGIRTPWIVRRPGEVRAGTRTASLISAIDLAPTLLDLAGVDAPSTMTGKSFRPILDDPHAEIREHVFAEHDWHDFDDHQRAVRTVRFKYIRTAYPDVPLTPPADAVRSPTFQAMRRLRDEGKLTVERSICFRAPRPAEELYDLDSDPFELRNLAASAEHRAKLERLRDVLDRWERETGDRVPERRTPDGFDRETGVPLPRSNKESQ